MLRYKQSSVHFYPWLGPENKHRRRPLNANDAQQTVNTLLNWLSKYMGELNKEEKFRTINVGHRLLLIADFVNLATIVTYDEIKYFLSGLALGPTPEEPDRYLFLLEKLNLIRKTIYGTTHYYLSRTERTEYIIYAFKGETGTADRMRLRDILLEMLEPLDEHRKAAFKASATTSGK